MHLGTFAKAYGLGDCQKTTSFWPTLAFPGFMLRWKAEVGPFGFVTWGLPTGFNWMAGGRRNFRCGRV